MEHGYFVNYVAQAVVAERLNFARRERLILDRVKLSPIIDVVLEKVGVAVRHLTKTVDRQMRHWVDTQTACTWRDLTLANC